MTIIIMIRNSNNYNVLSSLFTAPSCAPVSSASRSYASVVGHASFPETLGSTGKNRSHLNIELYRLINLTKL